MILCSSQCFDGSQCDLKREVNWVIVWFLWIHYVRGMMKEKKGFIVYEAVSFRPFQRVSRLQLLFVLLLLFIFASSIKTRPRGNWNNLKNTPWNYFRSVVVSGHQPCFSSYSFGNLRFHRRRRRRRETNKKGTLGFYNAERQHKKHGIMLSIKAIFSHAPVEVNFSSFPAIKLARFFCCSETNRKRNKNCFYSNEKSPKRWESKASVVKINFELHTLSSPFSATEIGIVSESFR